MNSQRLISQVVHCGSGRRGGRPAGRRGPPRGMPVRRGVWGAVRLTSAICRCAVGSSCAVRAPARRASGAQADGSTARPTPSSTSGRIDVRCATSATICISVPPARRSRTARRSGASGCRSVRRSCGRRRARRARRVTLGEVAVGAADQDERLLLERQHVDTGRGDWSGGADQPQFVGSLADLVDDLAGRVRCAGAGPPGRSRRDRRWPGSTRVAARPYRATPPRNGTDRCGPA
jgi:hypothetical protein